MSFPATSSQISTALVIMPGVVNWIEKPLEVIQSIADRLPSDGNEVQAVREYFSSQLKSVEALAQIPSLNCHALHQLPPHCLVRYRCMVQDMFDPELHMARYKVTNQKTGSVSHRSGRYRDVACCAREEQIDVDAATNVQDQRLTLYCVPVPGEAAWVKSLYAQQSTPPSTPSTSTSPSRKRGREEEDGEEEGAGCNGESNGCHSAGPVSAAMGNSPMLGGEGGGGEGGANVLPDLNFPLPGEQGPACLVKVYEEEEDGLKVNDMLEVVGVLSVDPTLAQFGDQHPLGVTMSAAEMAAHTPPPSLVPRLHAVLVRKMQHNNPLLPPEPLLHPAGMQTVQCGAEDTRKELVLVLEQALFGDSLAAELLLCHLLSSVYKRADVLPVGKFAVNLTGSVTPGLAPHLHRLLASLTSQSHMIALSLETLNGVRLTPHKDYEANRLVSGQLQLAPTTHLTLDETAMTSGQLDTQGVKNAAALTDVIQWQRLKYDFGFHTLDFLTDLPTLVVSEGLSFLPKDVHVPLRPVSVPDDVSDHYARLLEGIGEDQWNKWRTYITACRSLHYTVNDELQQALQEEFVAARRDEPSAMTVDDFHRLLTLVRLMTLSHCQPSCTPQILNHVLDVERARRSRTSTPAAASNA